MSMSLARRDAQSDPVPTLRLLIIAAAVAAVTAAAAVALPGLAEAAEPRDPARLQPEPGPRSAIEFRIRGLSAVETARALQGQGLRDPAAVARVLIAADYEPVEVERALIEAFRLARNTAIQAVRDALSAHSAVAGQHALRATVCYRADGALVACPRSSTDAAARTSDPAVAALIERLENLETAAADTMLRQSLRIRDLQQAAAGSAATTVSSEDQFLTLSGSRRERVGESTHLTVGDSRLEKLGGSLHQTIGQDRRERIGGNLGLKVDQSTDLVTAQRLALQSGSGLYIKAGMDMVIEAGSRITLKVGGNFIDMDNTGINLRTGNTLRLGGSDILMNTDPIITPTGGSAGSGNYQVPADPIPPLLPE